MFRSDLRDRCLPIPEGWVHDEWIAMIAGALANLRAIEQPLIRYRVHGSQQVGFVNKFERRALGETPAERHWDRVAQSAMELQQLCDVLATMVLESDRKALLAYQQHLRFLMFRRDLPASRTRRLAKVVAGLQRYRIHASYIKSAIKDVAFQKKR